MTEREKCESCIHAKPYGGENDNRCSAWSCEYINRAEAIDVWKKYQSQINTTENIIGNKSKGE